MKEFLEHSAKAVALISFCGLVVSVAYEWAYFLVVGSEFQRLASVSDYFANAVVWLPSALLGVLFSFALELALRRSELWLTEEELVNRTPNPEAVRRMRRRPFILMAYMFPVMGLIALLIFPPFAVPFFLLLAFCAWWPIFIWSVFSHPNAPKIDIGLIRLGLVLAPMFLAMAFTMGWTQGHVVLMSKDSPHIIQRSGRQEERTLILKSFEKGLLVRDVRTGTNDFLRWDDIKKISRATPEPSTASLVCWAFRLFCLPPWPSH